MLKALSVSEISGFVTKIFEAEELLHYVKVYGEVSGLSLVRGNLYFNLKDEFALMPCIMFGASGVNVKEGDQVIVTGGLRYYSKGGRLNLYVTSMAPYGSGVLYQRFIELKNRLEEEGVFSKEHKKPLPKKISTIGVITSKTGAVLHDIETVSHRRNPSLNIVVYPARVQGDGAEKTIIDGLKYFDKQKDIDVIIIARGGGSIEDLQPFNTESLAREIIKTSKPVVSAVGHETDFTICDFASSIRGATPSEGAELVSQNIFEGWDKFKNNLDKIYYLVQNLIDEKYNNLDAFYKKANMIFIETKNKKQIKFSRIIAKLLNIQNFNKAENNLKITENKLQAVNPQDIISRGYARISRNGKVIKSVSKVKVNDDIKIELSDGTITSHIKEIMENE